MLRMLAAAITLGVFVIAGSSAHGAVDPVAVCKEKKAQATGKFARALLRASGRHIVRPDAGTLFFIRERRLAGMGRSFARAEGKGGCQTDDDVETIATQVELLVADVVAEMEPGRFVDNGDGTITDTQTGLMWEQKDDNNARGVHDVDNRYTWTEPMTDGDYTDADGTAFTVFLNTLNNRCDGDKATGCTDNSDCTGIGNGLCGHAGYRDWRLPEVHRQGARGELDSLVYLAGPGRPQTAGAFTTPCTPGCTLPGCSCTGTRAGYWSSTSTPHPRFAWYVDFFDHFMGLGFKDRSYYVRAVRGGSPSAAFLDVTSGILD